MTYKWARDYALMLIDQYSVAGEKVAPGYNNQADYLAKIPRLLDDAATVAATSIGHRMRATALLSSLEKASEAGFTVYTLPADCWQMCSVGWLRAGGHKLARWQGYTLVGRNCVAVPDKIDTTGMMVEYWRYPKLLGENPAEDTELDNSQEVQMALPYYAAARLVMLDNSFAYATLMNEFQARMDTPGEAPQVTVAEIDDVYE